MSAPVYDSSKTPPLFLGVVGIDFTLKALDAALGVNDSTSAESFRRVVERSTARCPRLELTACELESYRQSNTVGNDAVCNIECTDEDLVQVREEKCPFVSDYPGDVWVNRDNEDVAFSDKACCRLSDSFAEPDQTCTAPDGDDLPVALIVSVIAAGVLGALFAAVLYYRRNKPKEGPSSLALANVEETEQEIQGATSNPSNSNSNSLRGRLVSDRSFVSESSERTAPPPELAKDVTNDDKPPILENKDQCRSRTAPSGNGNGDPSQRTVVAVEASEVLEEDNDESMPAIRLYS